jgi:hypothetical protein
MSITSQKRLVSNARRALLGMRARPRSGKVARLPYATRERINLMIEDGFPYKAIIEKLSQEGLLPYPVSDANISNWRNGGYQEWRQAQQQKEARARQTATALDKLFHLANG